MSDTESEGLDRLEADAIAAYEAGVCPLSPYLFPPRGGPPGRNPVGAAIACGQPPRPRSAGGVALSARKRYGLSRATLRHYRWGLRLGIAGARAGDDPVPLTPAYCRGVTFGATVRARFGAAMGRGVETEVSLEGFE